MDKKVALTDEFVISKIYLIRGQKVMLDRDLAELYQVETKQLKRAVVRNQIRFPEDFMFTLSNDEFANLRSQFGTSSWGGVRYRPMASKHDSDIKLIFQYLKELLNSNPAGTARPIGFKFKGGK